MFLAPCLGDVSSDVSSCVFGCVSGDVSVVFPIVFWRCFLGEFFLAPAGFREIGKLTHRGSQKSASAGTIESRVQESDERADSKFNSFDAKHDAKTTSRT